METAVLTARWRGEGTAGAQIGGGVFLAAVGCLIPTVLVDLVPERFHQKAF